MNRAGRDIHNADFQRILRRSLWQSVSKRENSSSSSDATMPVRFFKVTDSLPGAFCIFDFAAGAASDVAAYVYDEYFIRHVDLALVHVVQHLLGAFSPYLFVSGVAEEPDADDDVSFEGKAFLRFNELVFEAGAAAEGDDFVWALHQR